jgi:hypothetical protein
MLADRSEDAPADAIKWAKGLYRTRVVEKPAGILQRINALVTADIAPGQLAFGERSGGAGQARQMLFEAGDNAIDLRVTSAKGTFEIRGQILGPGFDNADIRLSGPDVKGSAKAGGDATFSFSNVPAGEYSLTASGETAEIVIEQLTLN